MNESMKHPCTICKKPTHEKICVECLQSYVPKVQAFLDARPGIIYIEAVLSKDLPIPRETLYILQEAGIIKLRDRR